ncbi:MAG: ATP-binding cassette domain-containing protein, partial [Alphaproteobacteria bacterium]
DPTSGKIVSGQRDITALNGSKLREWRASCAMIFQQFNLVNRLDVITNVMLGRVATRSTFANISGLFTDEERRTAFELLSELDMAKHALNRADGISGGQAQRVAIARALMQNPSIILADEPVASLDPRNAKVVMESLRSINRLRGITVICNLHNLSMAKNYCDRVVAMVEGRVIFDCLPGELDANRVRAVYGSEIDDLDSSMADIASGS